MMTDQVKQERIAKIAQMRLLDDDLMKVAFKDNIPATELVLRIILEDATLNVKSVDIEYVAPNLKGKGIRLDVKAVDAAGKHYDIEIQRSNHGAGERRARYNSSLMDASLLDKGSGTNAEELPETYVIFITEGDPLKKDLPIYHINRVIKETGELFNDGEHIIYVNSKFESDDPLGKLMADFRCADPGKMHYHVLADSVNAVKNTAEGVNYMCQIMEDEFQKGVEQEKEHGISAMVKAIKAVGGTIYQATENLMAEFALSQEAAEKKVQRYW